MSHTFIVPFARTSNPSTENIDCPFCNDSNTHIVRVDVYRGNDKTSISENEVRTGVVETSPCDRGAVVDNVFHCEGGHEFITRFSFHEGMTFTEVILVKHIPNLGWGYPLWRD